MTTTSEPVIGAHAESSVVLDGNVVHLTHSDYRVSNGVICECEDGLQTEIAVLDGVVYDASTGEAIGTATPQELAQAEGRSISDGLAEWILGKLLRFDARTQASNIAIMDAEARIAMRISDALAEVERNPETIADRAIVANAMSIIAKCKQSIDFMHGRYLLALGDWAAMNLGTSSSRTWSTPLGCVSLSAVPARVSVGDEDAAIEWAKKVVPEAVKTTEKFLISAVPKDVKESFIQNPDAATDCGLVVTPKSEDVTIRTGAVTGRKGKR